MISVCSFVWRTQSLSEAARQLDQTPSSVSARLKRIEEELGVRLVERTTRSLRLTPEGERFVQTCDTITSTWTRGRACFGTMLVRWKDASTLRPLPTRAPSSWPGGSATT